MRWTSQGLAGLPGWRERVEEGERTIKEAGGRLVGVYVTLGRYDVVEIFEAPDDEVAVEILMKLQRYGVEKVYEVEVEGEPDEAALAHLRRGVDLDDGRTAPAEARRIGPSKLELVLHEGRNRQVKRMCEAVGHPVKRLQRSAYAGLTLEGLEPGAWRELEPSEIERLRAE